MNELAKPGREMPSGKPLPETAFTKLLRDTITAPQDRWEGPDPGRADTHPGPGITDFAKWVTQADVDALIAKRREKV
jgi:hypothetical protein